MQNLVEVGATDSISSDEYVDGDAASNDDLELGCSSIDNLQGSEEALGLYSPLHSRSETRSATTFMNLSTDKIENSTLSGQSNDRNTLTFSDASSGSIHDISAQSSCLSRRRTHTGSGMRSISTSSTTTTTSSASFLRRNSSQSNAIDEECSVGGLRASLDSGMAAVRRWIRSRPQTSLTASNDAISFDGRPRRSRNLHSEDFDLRTHDEVNTTEYCSNQEDLINIENTPPSIIIEDTTSTQQLSSPAAPEMSQDTIAYRNLRQRALSEPDAVGIRDIFFQRALYAPQRNFLRRRFPVTTTRQPRRSRRRSRGNSIELSANANGVATASSQLSSSAAEVLYSSSHTPVVSSDRSVSQGAIVNGPEARNFDPVEQGEATNGRASSAIDSSLSDDSAIDPHRGARNRWIRINRRFQLVVAIVRVIFSFLLFAMLVCWVVLTSAYVVSIEQECDVPLKYYFWFVTLQLVLDVFRNDIMRLFLRWDASSTQRIPCRVVTYNAAYLIYAFLVLRLGINSVFLDDSTTCDHTAPQLFQASTAFATLSIAAWATIIIGYLVPFFVVATLLTINGYSPSSESRRDGGPIAFTMFSAAMGAPPGLVDELPILVLEDFPSNYPMECCICMENFTGTEVIVETACNHVFHKQCCREWLRQARTCPVCRTDLPAGMEARGGQSHVSRPQSQPNSSGTGIGFVPPNRPFARNDLHHEMVNLIQIIRRHERRQRSAD